MGTAGSLPVFPGTHRMCILTHNFYSNHQASWEGASKVLPWKPPLHPPPSVEPVDGRAAGLQKDR